MKVMLETGDKVKLFPATQLMKILQMRNFCTDDDVRQKVADEIGGKEGTVNSIEEKYAFDYFYFLPADKKHGTYSIPYEAVDFIVTI